MDPSRALALELARGLAPTASNLSRLAQEVGEETARWAIGQWDLRKKAAAKFELAEQMLFDRDGLEMASHPAIAAYHASRFPPRHQVVEIGAGIGADTIALARLGPVVSYELDPKRVEMAQHNLELHGARADVRCEDGIVHQAALVFADPTRRSPNQRRLSLRDLQPSPFELVARFGEGLLLGIKLSPMTADGDLADLTAGRNALHEFVSFGRECREALVWMGTSVAEGGVIAVHIESGERLAETPILDNLPMPLAYIYEADPASIRAHALGAFGMAGLGDSNGYLTSDQAVETPWLRGYRVLYAGRGDVKETRSALKNLGAATPIVKQRGAGIDPGALAKQLRGEGKRAVVLMVWKVGASVRHAIVEPVYEMG